MKSIRDQLHEQRDRVGSWGKINRHRMKLIEKYSGTSILDVGCADGTYVQNLVSRGKKAFGVDILSSKQWNRLSINNFMVGDASNLPVKDKSVDTILAFEVLEHLPNFKSALIEFLRISRSNVILSVPNCRIDPALRKSRLTYHHWIDRTHVNSFTRESLLKSLLDLNYEITYSGYIHPLRPEILFLRSFRIPLRLAEILSSITVRLPIRKNLYLTLVAVAAVK